MQLAAGVFFIIKNALASISKSLFLSIQLKQLFRLGFIIKDTSSKNVYFFELNKSGFIFILNKK